MLGALRIRKPDEIGDADNSGDASNVEFGASLLIGKVYGSRNRDPSVLDVDAHMVARDSQVPIKRVQHAGAHVFAP
jgi:hypothetical protein